MTMPTDPEDPGGAHGSGAMKWFRLSALAKVAPGVSEAEGLEAGSSGSGTRRLGGHSESAGNHTRGAHHMAQSPLNKSVSLMAAAGAFMGPNGHMPANADSIVAAVKSLRRASIVIHHTSGGNGSPGLAAKNGSLAFSFYAPHPTPGKGVVFSPDGQFVLRFGYGNDIKLLRSSSGAVIATLASSQAGAVRFATFSSDSDYILAASDDCRLLVWSTEKAVEGGRSKALVADIDVGQEPLAYCLLSPDGESVLSCDDDGQLELWSVSRMTMLHRFEVGHPSKRASFAMDGAMIVSCADFDIQVTLVDVESGEVVAVETFDGLDENRNKATYVISGDGSKVLVYITDQCYLANVAIYDTNNQTYSKLLVCGGAVMHCEFSADGADFIVAGRDNRIHVYDTDNASVLVSLEGHTSDVMFCRVSADRRYAISGDNSGSVMMWDVDHGCCFLKLQAHHAPVVSCDLSRDCMRAYTLDAEGHAFLWFLDMQSLYDVMRQQSDQLCCCEFGSGGKQLAVGYLDGSVKLWNMGRYVTMQWSHSKHGCPVAAVAFSADGTQLASGGYDGKIVITDVASGSPLATLSSHTSWITGLHYSSESGVLLSCARNRTMCVWPARYAQNSEPLLTIEVPSTAELNACAINSSGKLAAAACSCGTVYIFSLADGQKLHQFEFAEVSAQHVAFTSNGRLLAVGFADGTTRLFDVTAGELVRTLVGNAAGVHQCYFTGESRDLEDARLVSVCSRQALTWDAGKASRVKGADFISDRQGLFNNNTLPSRTFVAHTGLSLFDPTLDVAIFDLREYDKHPGDAFLLRDGTAVMTAGVHQQPLIVYSPPSTVVHMLISEAGGARSLDFSSDGHLLVAGNLRGELSVWDVEHHLRLHHWTAHKRTVISCVKFSHDGDSVYSCGEDCKVILWNWRTQSQICTLAGHQAPVCSVEMSLDGSVMASGDKDGIVIVWDTATRAPRRIIPAHEGHVLCCSVSPDGRRVATSGADEHIVILDAVTGEELVVLDDAMDGKALTIKFSFDGEKVQIGGEKGSILIWDVAQNCLLYDIAAHDGKVYDCSWSGDSRRLLSVGSDGRARLWDAAAGSEICAANFERGFGVVEAGGFIKCDLSVHGDTMAGCTAKGQLVLWQVGADMRASPDGSMLYQWLASMPLSRAREIYAQLLEHFPLLMNTQDSRGWTILMHAAHDSNPEITKLITSNVRSRSGMLGLMASPLRNSPGMISMPPPASMALPSPQGSGPSGEDGLSGEAAAVAAAAAVEKKKGLSGFSLARRSIKGFFKGAAAAGSSDRKSMTAVETMGSHHAAPEGDAKMVEPNAVKIALKANSADCVSHILDAVLGEKVTPGSYQAITAAICDVAGKYPEMCQTFLTGLPLRTLGEIEIPSQIAAQGVIVRAAPSYTSYKELWHEELELDKVDKGVAMVVMEAVMVRLPFAAAMGTNSILNTLVECQVPVETFGSATVKAIIDYKWKQFAMRQIYTKSLVYFIFVLLYTAYCIVFSDDVPTDTFYDVLETRRGIAQVAMSIVLFMFGVYYMAMEMFQLYQLGPKAYIESFWNMMDLFSYAFTLIIMPCVMARVGVGMGQFVSYVMAIEVVLLWVKQTFFALAVDGLGTFIYMTVQIIKGMGYFMVLLLALFVGFGVAFMVLFRGPGVPGAVVDDSSTPADVLAGATGPVYSDAALTLFNHYGSMGHALLSAFLVVFGNEDPRNALDTDCAWLATILLCVYNFMLIVVLLNMLITLMGEVYKKVTRKEQFVFLKGRGELIIEVESTMGDDRKDSKGRSLRDVPPYLHLLRPVAKQRVEDADDKDNSVEGMIAALLDAAGGGKSGGAGGGGGGPGGPGAGDDDESSDDDAVSMAEEKALGSPLKIPARLNSMRSTRSAVQRKPVLLPATSFTSTVAGGGGSDLHKEVIAMRKTMEMVLRQMKSIEQMNRMLLAGAAGASIGDPSVRGLAQHTGPLPGAVGELPSGENVDSWLMSQALSGAQISFPGFSSGGPVHGGGSGLMASRAPSRIHSARRGSNTLGVAQRPVSATAGAASRRPSNASASVAPGSRRPSNASAAVAAQQPLLLPHQAPPVEGEGSDADAGAPLAGQASAASALASVPSEAPSSSQQQGDGFSSGLTSPSTPGQGGRPSSASVHGGAAGAHQSSSSAAAAAAPEAPALVAAAVAHHHPSTASHIVSMPQSVLKKGGLRQQQAHAGAPGGAGGLTVSTDPGLQGQPSAASVGSGGGGADAGPSELRAKPQLGALSPGKRAMVTIDSSKHVLDRPHPAAGSASTGSSGLRSMQLNVNFSSNLGGLVIAEAANAGDAGGETGTGNGNGNGGDSSPRVPQRSGLSILSMYTTSEFGPDSEEEEAGQGNGNEAQPASAPEVAPATAQ